VSAVTTWTTKHYDLDGNLVATLAELTDRQLNFTLNGLDSFGATMYLDDDDAADIRRLYSVIKVWRDVADVPNSKSYTAPGDEPDFCGIVSYTSKDAEANTFSFKAFSPFWRLQSRFHLINHYLAINPDTGVAFKQSELMWKLIDLINEAFGADDPRGTGIFLGTLSSATDISEAPYFVERGSNTYQHIFETIMQQSQSPDIVPTYFHSNGDSDLVEFNTEEKRGSDLSATTKFQYGTGAKNCINVTEEESVEPGKFANYVWVIGQGGPNAYSVQGSDDFVPHQRKLTGTDSFDEIGVYMANFDYPDTKSATIQNDVVNYEFQRAIKNQRVYTVELSPLWPPYYKTDFDVGDVVRIDVDKGAFVVTNVKQRIYEIGLAMSDNNVESCAVTLSEDFDGAVATTP
jgi:hypothetical protein